MKFIKKRIIHQKTNSLQISSQTITSQKKVSSPTFRSPLKTQIESFLTHAA